MDSRFKALAKCLGSEELAIGRLVMAWRIAQEWWERNKQPIPQNIWELNGLGQELFDVSLARKTADGVYVSGSTERFEWIFSKKKAGVLSGVSRRKKRTNEHDTVSVRTKHEQTANINEPPTPTPTPTPSPSPSPKQDNGETTNTVTAQKNSDAVAGHDRLVCKLIWEAYQTAYHTRYLKDPVRNATVNKQVVNLSKRLGKDAIEVVKFYVDHNKGFYVEKCHPIGLCLSDAEALHTQWFRGRSITRNDVRQFEANDHVRSQLERIAKGEL